MSAESIFNFSVTNIASPFRFKPIFHEYFAFSFNAGPSYLTSTLCIKKIATHETEIDFVVMLLKCIATKTLEKNITVLKITVQTVIFF